MTAEPAPACCPRVAELEAELAAARREARWARRDIDVRTILLGRREAEAARMRDEIAALERDVARYRPVLLVKDPA